MGHLGRDHAREDVGIGHRDDVTAVGHLHGRGIGVAVDGDDLDAQPLQLDGNLLAELTGAEEHDADGGVGEGGTEAMGHSEAASFQARSARP